MECIDKYFQESAGETIISDFLSNLYHTAGTYDVGFGLYDVLRNRYPMHFHDLRNLLEKEQCGRCCYCMRRLAKANHSVEHLIEKTFRSTDRWEDYMIPATVLGQKTCLERDFVSANIPTGYLKFPHSVAYQNMVLSCKGWMPDATIEAKTCNLKRQHQTIAPFVLVSTINHDFYYKRNGFAFWSKDPHTINPAVKVLRLNHNTLRMIRRIWFYARDKGINVQSVTDRHAFLYGLLDDQIEDLIQDNGWAKMLLFTKDSYWNMLLEFDYFGTNRPRVV